VSRGTERIVAAALGSWGATLRLCLLMIVVAAAIALSRQ